MLKENDVHQEIPQNKIGTSTIGKRFLLYFRIKFVCMNVTISIFMSQLDLLIKVGLLYHIQMRAE